MPNGKIRYAEVYGAGAAIGFTPQQVDQMSTWQLQAAVAGYVAAHNPAAKSKMSKAERDELFDWIEGLATDETVFSTMTYRLDGEHLVEAGTVTFRIET